MNIPNPLADFVDDDIYELLDREKLLNYKRIEEIQLRREFDRLRATKLSVDKTIEILQKTYNHLAFNTIRKKCQSARRPVTKG